MNLAEIKEGESAILTEIGGSGALRQHFLDMGLIPGTRVTYVKAAPMGDPIEYRIWDYELTLRLSEAEQIQITDVQTLADEGEKQHNTAKKKSSGSKHPGLGEVGIYHVKQRGEKIGKDELLTFGLAGNQNCGCRINHCPCDISSLVIPEVLHDVPNISHSLQYSQNIHVFEWSHHLNQLLVFSRGRSVHTCFYHEKTPITPSAPQS